MPAMADWRQVQARIRKAKSSPDAPTKLHELYQRTHDAMVAWELGVVEEKAERTDEAVKWYTIAVERFRRSDWKKKAEDALTRLGAPLPEPGAKPSAEPIFASRQAKSEDSTEEDLKEEERADEVETASARLALGEIADEEEESDESEEGETPAAAEAGAATPGDSDPNKKKRRRGRRGGRGRRRKGAPQAPGLPAQTFAEPSSPAPASVDAPAQHGRPQHSQRPAHTPRPENSRNHAGRNESYGRHRRVLECARRSRAAHPHRVTRTDAAVRTHRARPRWRSGAGLAHGETRFHAPSTGLQPAAQARRFRFGAGRTRSISVVGFRSDLLGTTSRPARPCASAWETWPVVLGAAQPRLRAKADRLPIAA